MYVEKLASRTMIFFSNCGISIFDDLSKNQEPLKIHFSHFTHNNVCKQYVFFSYQTFVSYFLCFVFLFAFFSPLVQQVGSLLFSELCFSLFFFVGKKISSVSASSPFAQGVTQSMLSANYRSIHHRHDPLWMT